MKILFLIASLRGGGAERVASLLCNHWAQQKHQIVLVTFDSPQNDFYQSSSQIIRHSIENTSNKVRLNIVSKIYFNFKRLFKLRAIIKQEQPDVVVSFMDIQNMLASLACIFTGIPVIISERTYPPYFNDNNLFDKIRKNIYKLSSAFVAQTSDVAGWARKFLANKQINVIANPLYNLKDLSALKNQPREKSIIAVGRLCPEKGFDLLIAAFKKIHAKFPEWRLLIIGEGAERKNLEHIVHELLLQDNVVLLGQTPTPELYYASAQIFVLSSRVEGFPNVLLEAMAAGMPAISFDCNSGPADIIQHGINGLLVPANDVEALANELDKLMQDQDLRDRLSATATEVKNKYNLEVISQQWLELFARITN